MDKFTSALRVISGRHKERDDIKNSSSQGNHTSTRDVSSEKEPPLPSPGIPIQQLHLNGGTSSGATTPERGSSNPSFYSPTFAPAINNKLQLPSNGRPINPVWKKAGLPPHHLPSILNRYQAISKGDGYSLKHGLPMLKGAENIGAWSIHFLERCKKLGYLQYVTGGEPEPVDPRYAKPCIALRELENAMRVLSDYKSANKRLMAAIKETVPRHSVRTFTGKTASNLFEQVLDYFDHLDGFMRKSWLWWDFTAGPDYPKTCSRFGRKVNGSEGKLKDFIDGWTRLMMACDSGELGLDDDMKACAFLAAMTEYDPIWVEDMLQLVEKAKAAKAVKLPGLEDFVQSTLAKERKATEDRLLGRRQSGGEELGLILDRALWPERQDLDPFH